MMLEVYPLGEALPRSGQPFAVGRTIRDVGKLIPFLCRPARVAEDAGTSINPVNDLILVQGLALLVKFARS